MKRLGLAVAVAVAVLMVAPAVAWGQASAVCNGQLCSSGWYTTPVSTSWNLNGEPNVAGCAPQTYVQDTNQSNLVPNPADLPPWAYCVTSVPGGTDTRFLFIKIELSAPTATVAPSRPPDSGAWYNHPVAGAASATAFSGIASCSATTYPGPSTTTATVSATCVDNAGKSVTVTSSPFAYDTTPPSLTAAADAGDRSVALSWQTGGALAPVAAVVVTRSPGGTVYNGGAGGYVDTDVKDGVPYTYTITAVDQAGNASTQTLTATPQAHLVAPSNTAHVASPPLLSWTPVRGATYYNVQLYRDGKSKVLSAWPAKAELQLRHSWRYHGRRYRLKPGRYRWLVWPGYGKRRSAHYGHMIGSWTFVMAR